MARMVKRTVHGLVAAMVRTTWSRLGERLNSLELVPAITEVKTPWETLAAMVRDVDFCSAS